MQAAEIEEADFSPILRAREDAASPADVAAGERVMLAALDRLSQPDHASDPLEPAEQDSAA